MSVQCVWILPFYNVSSSNQAVSLFCLPLSSSIVRKLDKGFSIKCFTVYATSAGILLGGFYSFLKVSLYPIECKKYHIYICAASLHLRHIHIFTSITNIIIVSITGRWHCRYESHRWRNDANAILLCIGHDCWKSGKLKRKITTIVKTIQGFILWHACRAIVYAAPWKSLIGTWCWRNMIIINSIWLFIACFCIMCNSHAYSIWQMCDHWIWKRAWMYVYVLYNDYILSYRLKSNFHLFSYVFH